MRIKWRLGAGRGAWWCLWPFALVSGVSFLHDGYGDALPRFYQVLVLQ